MVAVVMRRPGTGSDIVRNPEPYRGDVEIRVHGVSGTPPEELLDRPTTERVSGDRIAGFYRPAATGQRRDAPRGAMPGTPEVDEAPWLEGYSWGGWTSGAKSRALWLVLAPFALVNVAPRMLPPDAPGPGPSGGSRPSRLRLLIAALIRVLAASLTVTLVLGVTAASLTTVARRCSADPTPCYGLPKVLTDVLARLAPSVQVGVMTVVPLALVALLWLLGLSSARRYATGRAEPMPGRPDDAPVPLLRSDLWHGGVAGRRLRLLHVETGVLTVGTVLAVLFPPSGLRTVAVLVSGASLLAASVLAGIRLGVGRGEPAVTTITGGVRWLWLGVAGTVALDTALVIAGAGVGADAAGLDPDRLVRDADRMVGGLFEAQGALLLVVLLLLITARWRGAGRGRDMFVKGYAAFYFAFLGWLLGSMMTAAVLILVPAWLGSPGFSFTPARVSQVLAEHPTWFGGTTRSSGIGMLVGVGVLLVLLVQLGARYALRQSVGGTAKDRADVRSENGLTPEQLADRGVLDRVRQIAFMRWTARLVDRVPRGIAGFSLAIIAFLVLQGIAVLVPTASRPAFLAFVLGQDRQACDAGAQACDALGTGPVAWGAYLTAGLLVGLLLLGVLAYRTAAMRRGVGVLWDLACFWPRDVHPFAPPCYNERTMPEVRIRISYYLTRQAAAGPDTDGEPDPAAPDSPVGRVVIAGHSQGTVISLAAVLIQPPEVRARLALMTFGCVLDRLYSRFFPRYFSPEVYRCAAENLTGASGQVRWVNLWRDTDYLGGSMPYPRGADWPAGPLQVRCTDPVFDRAPGDVVYPVAGRHSAFWLDPTFQEQVRGLLRGMP